MIYLDYNATTPLAPAAAAAMEPFLGGGRYGNASSVHRAGREARAAIDLARDEMAALLGVRPGELIFTSGGTEADNLGVMGLALAAAPRGRHVVTSSVEHHAVLHACAWLEERAGFEVTRLPVEANGRVAPEQVQEALRPDTVLVSLMSANNETGTRQPVEEVAALCRERGVLLHTDAIQTFGKEPLSAAPFAALSLAAHKFYGPQGAGLLYVRGGLPLERMLVGGSHEGERRAGTENVAAIAGMAAAAREATTGMAEESRRQKALREALWVRVREAFPGAVRNGDPDGTLPNTLNVCLPGWEAESLLMALDLARVCASSGSACMVGTVLPSHVLLAMGRSPELARSAVRFSLGRGTSSREIEETGQVLREIASRAEAGHPEASR